MRSGRPARWLLATSIAVLVAVALGTYALVRPDAYVAPPPPAVRTVDRPTLAAGALQRLQAALTARDRAAAEALAPAADQRAKDALAAIVDNAARLHVTGLRLRYVDADSGVGSGATWSAAVDVRWRFAGFDSRPVDEEVTVGFFDTAAGGTAITGFGGGDRRSPLWLTAPLEVRRTALALVLVDGTPDEADGYLRLAERAVPVVRRVLPRWRGRLVVEVPSSATGLDAALDADAGTYARIAAVSASVDGTEAPTSAIHIFVNPTLFGTLGRIGAQVVMSHEATHVATRAPTASGAPLWLVEGFADYVALRDVHLPIRRTAGQIIREVRGQGAPPHLPGPAEFAANATQLGASYEAAWQACVLVARRAGEPALVRLYRSVEAGAPLDQQLRRTTGVDESGLTRLWRQRLRGLARAPE